jgi:hypothetical protein
VVRSQGWSVYSGRTVGRGQSVIAGQVGWPGLSALVLRGTASNVDVGAKLSFNYGVEGVVTQIAPGLKFQGLMRFALLERGRAALGFAFAPGVLFYFPGPTSTVGITLPLQLTLGITASSALQAHVVMEMPLYVTFGSFGGVVVPMLFGGGVEYFLDRSLALSFITKMGPSVDTRLFASRASLAFEALVGLQYRL